MQLDNELFLSPGFPVPPNLDYKGYHTYVDEMLPPESPVLYGLHPNAEVGILTVTSNHLFQTVLEMQPREGSQGGEHSATMEEMVKSSLDEILEKIPEEFVMSEIMAKTQERSPYILVCFQECERMNILLREIRYMVYYRLSYLVYLPSYLGLRRQRFFRFSRQAAACPSV